MKTIPENMVRDMSSMELTRSVGGNTIRENFGGKMYTFLSVTFLPFSLSGTSAQSLTFPRGPV